MLDGVWQIESAYLRNVVDRVDDLDNVLYEVWNEAGSPYSDSWQLPLIDFERNTNPRKRSNIPLA